MAIETPAFKTKLHDLIQLLDQHINASTQASDTHLTLPKNLRESSTSPNTLIQQLADARAYCEQHQLTHISTKIDHISKALKDSETCKDKNDVAISNKLTFYSVLYHINPDTSIWEQAIQNALSNPSFLQHHFFSNSEVSANESYLAQRSNKILLCIDISPRLIGLAGNNWGFTRSAKIKPNDVKYIKFSLGTGHFKLNDQYELVESPVDLSSPKPSNVSG